MKKKLYKLMPAVTLALAAADASAQVLYEPFDYGVTTATNLSFSTSPTRFSTQGTYWATRGTASADNLRPESEASSSPLPSYMGGTNPTIPASFGSNARERTTGNDEYATLGLGDYFNAPGDLYWSAVIKPNTIPSTTTGVMMAGILSFTLPTPGSQPSTRQLTLWTRKTGTSTYQLGLGQNSGASSDVVWSGDLTGTTDSQFVVAHLTINGNTPDPNPNDTLEMWVNPTSNFGDTTAAPAANAFAHLTLDSTSDLTDSIPNTLTGSPAHAGFFIRSGAGGSGNMVFDDIRVDSTWAGVTPDGNKQFTWTGASTGGNLSDATWSKTAANPAASPNGLGAVANFGTLGVAGTALDAGAVITTAGETIDSINIRNPNPITIAGSGITIASNASAGQIVAYSGGAHTISAPITLQSNLAIKADSDASITLTGAVSGAGKTLQKFGQGNIVLGAENLLAADVSLDVRAGTLDLGGFAQRADTVILGVGHENPGSGLGGPDNSPGTITNGTVLTANTFDLRSGTIDVVMAGGNVIKNRATTITLNHANTYTGSTTINGGTLSISSEDNLGAVPASVVADNISIAGSAKLKTTATMTLDSNRGINLTGTSPALIDVASGTTLTYGGVMSGTGGMTEAGTGTLILNGVSTYAGATNVVGGTIRTGADNALPVTTVLGVNGDTAVVDFGDPSNTGFNQTVAGIINNGSSALATITNSGSSVKTLTVNGDTDSNVTFPITGNLKIVKDGAGLLSLAVSNSFVGPDTVVNGGALTVGTTTSVPGYLTGDLTLATGAAFGGRLGDTPLTTADLDAIQQSTTIFDGPNKNLAIEIGGTTPITYSTPIANISGTRGLIKYGGGTLVLDGVNTYSGDTTINGGTLSVGSQANLGDGSATNNLSFNGGTLLTTASLGDITKTVSLADNANADTIDTGGFDTTISGPISGDGRLKKAGAGVLTLSGNNTYSGRTTISGAGAIRITSANALGDAIGDTFISGGGAADVDSSLQIDGAGAGGITSAEPIVMEGKSANTLTPHINNLSGNNSLTGDITFDAGGSWFNLASNGGTLTVANVINGLTGTTARQLNLSGTAEGIITGGFADPGAAPTPLVKSDSGTWTVGGTNTYTGATTVNAGTLILASSITKSSELNIQPGAIAELAAGGGNTLATPSLVIAGATDAWTAQLDVKDNDVIVHSDDASRVAKAAEITNQLKQGANFANAGQFWTGQGIITSLGGNGSTSYTAVGVAVNDFATLGGAQTGAIYSTFDGQDVGVNDVLVKYTYFGDADLDGAVTTNDYFQIDNGFLGSKTGWINGDFDYDGAVTTNDYFLIDNAFLGQGSALVPAALASARALSGVTAVPEPASLGILAFAAAGLLARRRRR
jgi:autotransporter-associated beta strand protein